MTNVQRGLRSMVTVEKKKKTITNEQGLEALDQLFWHGPFRLPRPK